MSYGHADVFFLTPRGRVVVHALVSSTPAERERGLRGTRFLPWGSGMLFPFRPWQTPAMTMVGVDIPIDMVFLDGHRIVGIYAAVPGQARIEGPTGTHWVLEVPGAFAEREWLAIGQAAVVTVR